MPTVYAHWRFGVDCIQKMPSNLQKIVNDNIDIFNLGVHGPDIFFYDLANKDVLEYGYKLHKEPAKFFFEKSKQIYKQSENRDASLAYILGFLTHFVLDSTCHGYVDRKKEFSNITHNKVEAQWDRHVIIQDNRIFNLVDRSESLKPTIENAKIIAQFYPFDEKIVLRATKNQKRIVKTLNCMYETKEKILKTVLKDFGMYNYADLFIGFREEEICEDSNLRLDKLRAKALTLFPKLMNNLMSYLKGKEKLNKYFDHNFEAWDNYKDIPILEYEEELKYKV